MAHVQHSTPTAGLEVILDVTPLDLFMQCVAVQAVLKTLGRNHHSRDGIGCSCLRGTSTLGE